jgi:hypothetical protein
MLADCSRGCEMPGTVVGAVRDMEGGTTARDGWLLLLAARTERLADSSGVNGATTQWLLLELRACSTSRGHGGTYGAVPVRVLSGGGGGRGGLEGCPRLLRGLLFDAMEEAALVTLGV